MELGATHVVNSKDVDPVAAIREITAGGVNFALESTGRPAVLRQAVDALASRGALGVVGAPALGVTAEFDVNDLLLGGKSIRGIVEGDSVPQKFIPELVELYLQGRFPFDRLVKFYSFKDINQAAEDSEKGLTLKPVIRIHN
ncbi:Aryl-alcohol dehydrogenase [compost metagenome]